MSLSQDIQNLQTKLDAVKQKHEYQQAAKSELEGYEKSQHIQKAKNTVSEIHGKVEELETHLKNAASEHKL